MALVSQDISWGHTSTTNRTPGAPDELWDRGKSHWLSNVVCGKFYFAATELNVRNQFMLLKIIQKLNIAV